MKKANQQKFGKNLRYLRSLKDWTRKDLGDRLGISEDRVKNWEVEAGSFPRATILIQLVDLLDYTDIYSLLTEDIRPKPSKTNHANVYDPY